MEVGGRLTHHKDAWMSLQPDVWTSRLVSTGLEVPWIGGPPTQFGRPRQIPSAIPEILHDLMIEMLQKGIIEETDPPPQGQSPPGMWYSNHFVIPKSDPGKYRHIFNMKPANVHVEYTHFKMESVQTALALLRPGDFMTKIDISDAFSHVPIAESCRDFFRLEWKGRHWRFKAMPFGYSDAPRTFTKLMKTPIAVLRGKGVRLVIYVDDILIMAESEELCTLHTAWTKDLLTRLGFVINEKKSIWTPSQTVEFLGTTLDSSAMEISVPHRKIAMLHHQIRSLLNQDGGEGVLTASLASVLGGLRATHVAFKPAMLMSRSMQHELARRLRLPTPWSGEVENRWHLSPLAREELIWWEQNLMKFNGCSMIPSHPHFILTTDASGTGWGGWLAKASDPDVEIASCEGRFDLHEKCSSSNRRESLATLYALFSMRTEIQRDAVILIRTDNKTNAYNIGQGGGHSPAIVEIMKMIFDLAWRCGWQIQVEYLPGLDNGRADHLSRVNSWETSDWKLNPSDFQHLIRRWGPLEIDLFASMLNSQLPRYFSFRHDPLTSGVDALSHCWTDLRAYANPPFILMDKVLQKVRADQATIVLVFPCWLTAAWWPLLLERLVEDPVVLPWRPDLFLHSSCGNEEPSGKAGWRACAARVSGNTSLVKAYRTLLSQRLRQVSDATRTRLTQPLSRLSQGTWSLWDAIQWIPAPWT